jgi:hypothetical protein
MLADALADDYGLMGDLACAVEHNVSASRRMYNDTGEMVFRSKMACETEVNGTRHGIFYYRFPTDICRDRYVRGRVRMTCVWWGAHYAHYWEIRRYAYERSHGTGTRSYAHSTSVNPKRYDRAHGIWTNHGKIARLYWRSCVVAFVRA